MGLVYIVSYNLLSCFPCCVFYGHLEFSLCQISKKQLHYLGC